MGFINSPRWVRGDLFTESGKWKYTVTLEFEDSDYDDWDVGTRIKVALMRATENGISGVSLRTIPKDWTLVVLKPYSQYSYPHLVRG